MSTATVMTTDGPLGAESLGITLVHEHLLVDTSCWRQSPRTSRQRQFASRPLAMEFLGDVRRDPLVFEDNLMLEDAAAAAEELLPFRELGGQTVVELTVNGLGPDPEGIRRIGHEAGVRVVAGVGWYVQASHPPEIAAAGEEELAEALVEQMEAGIAGSGVRPGVIGEIGTSQPVHPDEWKVLGAACTAQQESGLPLYVHVYPGADGHTAPEVARFVLERGVDPAKVAVCHMDSNMEFSYQREVADLGVRMGLDCFGWEVYFDSMNTWRCHDSERETLLLRLLDAGYGDQLLISQDVCHKSQLRRFGGHGYSHLLENIVPSLTRRGADDRTISQLLVQNPREFLTS